jgi:acyl dehydratase
MKPMLFYEDMCPGQKVVGPGIVVDKSEMVAFATIWDPMPFHIDEEAGRAAFGGLTAPGIYVLALKQRLIHQLPEQHAVIASFGYDEVRFHEPVRPGDTLTLVLEWLHRRASTSKGDRGIVTVRFSLVNQSGTAVMSHLDTILVRRRESAAPPAT